jgi:hypothetical protein
LGKSTFASFLLEWYRYAGIPFAAVDADVAHQSLKNRYPDNTEPFPALKSKESFGVMLESTAGVASSSIRCAGANDL